MTTKMLHKDEYIAFFNDVNKALTTKEKGLEKITLGSILESHNVTMNLRPDLLQMIQPALDADMQAPLDQRKNLCAACSACALCAICGEINDGAGLGGLAGAAGLSS
ncbi:MAG: hypothetical protein HGB02_09670 [Chlorobiaceae bacterium]|nr:hypothetical protein [Chlorobiaceae bacterium]